MKTFLKAIAAFGCALVLSGPVHAAGEADGWPSRPLTFVVPFPPGGITDNTSRLLALKLGEKLGQQVVVDNRPGAGGSIGVEYAVRQPADGYTLIYGTQGTHAANLALYKNVRYDPVNDFTAVHGMSESPLILVINPNKPFKTVPELVAYARQNPGKLNFGSAGAGTATHLTAELFQTTAGVKMTHVPYKGSSPALTDLISGNLDLAFYYAAVVLPFVQSGKLKALAVTGDKRWPELPGVPTFIETGYLKDNYDSVFGIVAPTGTPQPVIEQLNRSINDGLNSPDVRDGLAKLGIEPNPGSVKDFSDYIAEATPRWTEIVRVTGIKVGG